MLAIPETCRLPCAQAGRVEKVFYGKKYLNLYTPAKPAHDVLYLIHGGGGDQQAYFCPNFLNMVDHMIQNGDMEPVFMVAPCFYDPEETVKTPAHSGVLVKAFIQELRADVIPAAEEKMGFHVNREHRAITGFSMGGVTCWYALMEALDLFSLFMPMSGDCWALGEKGGGSHTAETARLLAEAVSQQGNLPYRIHAVTGSKDIAYPNLDPQIRAMQAIPAFSKTLKYDVLEGGVHDYETIFRYLYNILPAVYPA